MGDELRNKKIDVAASALKAVTSAIPFAGGALSELLGQVIPGQRIERISSFIEALENRIVSLEIEQDKFNTHFIDLLEDAARQSLRALTQERNSYLVNFMTQSAGVDSDHYEVKKKLIQILSELTDLDLEILAAFDSRKDQALRRRFYVEPLAVGPYERLSEQEKYEYDSNRLAWHVHISTLEKLDLLSAEYERTPARLNQSAGMPRVVGHKITALGSLLLRSISELGPNQA